MINSVFESVLQQSLQTTKDYLNDFVDSSDVTSNLAIAFGDSFDRQQGLNVIELLVANNLDSLNIEIRSSQEINNGQGAYLADSNTIYLAEQYVTENLDNPDAIASVIIEEIGHYIDWRANIEDAPGDEGGANVFDVNPRFVNPEEGDFRIRSNSPAIDVGDGSVIDAEFDLVLSPNLLMYCDSFNASFSNFLLRFVSNE